MTESTSYLSSGKSAKPISYEALALIEAPERTVSHRPIKHMDVIERFEDVLESQGFPVLRQQHAMTPDGMRLFSLLEVKGETGDYRFAIALRHANDKSLSLQAVAGTRCFICDNMALSGDFKVLNRKHTSGVKLDELVVGAVSRILQSFAGISRQLRAYEQMRLTENQAKLIIYDACIAEKLQGCPRSLIKTVHDNYFEPKYTEFRERNMLSLSNAFTSSLKEVAVPTQYSVSAKLPKFLAAYCPEPTEVSYE